MSKRLITNAVRAAVPVLVRELPGLSGVLIVAQTEAGILISSAFLGQDIDESPLVPIAQGVNEILQDLYGTPKAKAAFAVNAETGDVVQGGAEA